MADIWFCGDTHSRFRHLIAAVKTHRPAAIVLLGDVEATKPLEDELAAILSLTDVFWIARNHDTDNVPAYDHPKGISKKSGLKPQLRADS